MPSYQAIGKEIRRQANPTRAQISARFFKTKKGEYGEGDIFIGLTVPQCRILANQFSSLSLTQVKKLIASKIHEERMIGLLILVQRFEKGVEKESIYNFYLNHMQFVNNWDLVDLSADKIVGEYLYKKPHSILYKLLVSKNVWERRIAIIATFAFIKQGEYKPTLDIALKLIQDKHDLIQKAVGWMLREVGKKCSKAVLVNFLKQHAHIMPRTMLRYAIERFPERERQRFLKQTS